jgi:O-antigen/teichoic acid export membrane protein
VLGSAVPIFLVVSDYRRQLAPSLIGLAVALALGTVLVPLSPLSGMAASVSAGLLLAAAIPMVMLHRHQDIHPFRDGFPRTALRAAALGVPVAALAWSATLLPRGAALAVIIAVALGGLWCTGRFALSEADRKTLGKTGRALRLI